MREEPQIMRLGAYIEHLAHWPIFSLSLSVSTFTLEPDLIFSKEEGEGWKEISLELIHCL